MNNIRNFSIIAAAPGQDQQAAEEDQADDDRGCDGAGVEGKTVITAGRDEADERTEQAEGNDGGEEGIAKAGHVFL